nr:S41 family peptidase [uncultured Sellimonas sp.]
MEDNTRKTRKYQLIKKAYTKGALHGALAMFLVIVILMGCLMAAGKISIFTKAIDTKTSKKTQEIEGIIEKNFLYADDVEKKDNRDFSIKGYVAGLGDPYSAYYNEEETKELFESTEGKYAGIGALMSQNPQTGEIRVEEVYENSPAEKAGMQAGDIFQKVDGNSVNDKELSDVVTDVKGEEGTVVTITVLRGTEEKDLKVTRKIVEAPTVKTKMLDGNIGYLQITEFDTVTYKQFKAGMDELEKQGMKGLVVDLRDNPGGNYDTVCQILDLLLPKGTIVYTEDKDGKRIDIKKSDEEHKFTKPLAVLVNENSASASEIFAGAIQDHKAGSIIGTKTFGKGIVQSLYQLSDGTCLKITTAQYFTPEGRNIHKKGIEPDITVKNEENSGQDKQLEKASEVVKNEMK